MKKRTIYAVSAVYVLLVAQFLLSNFNHVVGINYTPSFTASSFNNYETAHPVLEDCPALTVSSSSFAAAHETFRSNRGFPFATDEVQNSCALGFPLQVDFPASNIDYYLDGVYLLLLSTVFVFMIRTKLQTFDHKLGKRSLAR